MYLINLLIDNIPYWVAHVIIILGIIFFILGNIFKLYKPILNIFAVILIIVGVFYEGKIYTLSKYNSKIEELKEQVKKAEEKSEKVTVVIEEKVVEKIKVIKEKADANIQVIEKVVTKYDNLCTLSNAAIMLHNSSSQNEVSPSTGNSIEGTSDVKVSDLLRTVTENYATYYKTREQVKGWQDWYNEQKKIYESVK